MSDLEMRLLEVHTADVASGVWQRKTELLDQRIGEPDKIAISKARGEKHEAARWRARRIARGLPVRSPKGTWMSVELADSAQTDDGFACIVCRAPMVPNPKAKRQAQYCSPGCAETGYRARTRDRPCTRP